MTDAPSRTWWSAAEIAEARLPDLPDTKRGVNDLAKRENWATRPGLVRRRKGKGGGLEYSVKLFPMRARVALTQAEAPVEAEPVRDRAEVWAAFEALKAPAQTEAQDRLRAVVSIEQMEGAGLTRSEAVAQVARLEDKSERTLWNWLGLVEGIEAADRVAYLAPRHGGPKGRKTAPVAPDFFALVKSDFLRLEQPSFTACYDRAVRIAGREGLPVAPIHQVRRLYKATVSKPVELAARKGIEALRRFYPHQTRDKTCLRPMQAVQGDYHKFDLFVRWPGEALPVRPQAVVFSDIYSGKLLAWRLSITANSHTVQLAFGELVERFGIPEQALLDNGREFAAKVITGGAETRFRFKVKEDDIPGLLPMLGVAVHWATPYSGQSKPIERAFRDLCDRVSKHPAFEGAYTGNKPDAKPENYGNRAVPLEEFQAVLAEEVALHNDRPNRRSEVAFGRSFNQVFNEGYKTAPIRKATEAQRRLWLMGAEGIRAKRGNGELALMGSRYWSEWMYRIEGQKVVARFDPEDLHAGLHVYDLDGQYLGHAACVEKGDFFGVADAREVARKRSAYMRAAKEEARLHRELSAAEIAARLCTPETPVFADDLPQADVVQLPRAHPKAPQPPRRTPRPGEAEAIVAFRGPTDRSEDDDAEALFRRALDLTEMRERGETLTEAQTAFLDHYTQSPAYRSRMTLRAIKE
jgi:hypothetical protein